MVSEVNIKHDTDIPDGTLVPGDDGLPQYIAPPGYMYSMVCSTGSYPPDMVLEKIVAPFCRWCRSHAADDERGNCGACGGPR